MPIIAVERVACHDVRQARYGRAGLGGRVVVVDTAVWGGVGVAGNAGAATVVLLPSGSGRFGGGTASLSLYGPPIGIALCCSCKCGPAITS